MKNFSIIPAIDLIDGKCVRLFQGKYEQKKVYDVDPVDQARQFQDAGLIKIHIIDLDGARLKKPQNLHIVEEIAKLGLEIEFGGGLSSFDHISETLDRGVKHVIIGSGLVDYKKNELDQLVNKFQGKLIAGIDTIDGYMAIDGWKTKTSHTAIDIIKLVEKLGFTIINYTDISRDGAMSGPNIKQLKLIAKNTELPVIASGGIRDINDISAVKKLMNLGVNGVIVGKAIYDGKILLKDLAKC